MQSSAHPPKKLPNSVDSKVHFVHQALSHTCYLNWNSCIEALRSTQAAITSVLIVIVIVIVILLLHRV